MSDPADGPGPADTSCTDGVESPAEAGSAERAESTDAELIEAVRQGAIDSYEPLYQRHVAAARSLARQIARSPTEVDDLVSEAFAKVLDRLQAGGGPDEAFRAYLLTTLRRTAYDRTRRERRIQLSDDVAEVSGADLSVPFTDTAMAGLERSLVERAFEQLPERWRAVLWHIEVEGEAPSEVAPLFGLSANGVSALAYRAREGLRQAYLQAHLGQLGSEQVQRCRGVADRLGAWARGGLSRRERVQVDAHLDGCEHCRDLANELIEVNGGLRAIIAPLVLGTSAVGYFATGAGAAIGSGAAGGGAGAAGAAGGHAAGEVPRQATISGFSAGALVAAVAVAMTGATQAKPVATPAPPAAVQPPARPAPPAPRPPKRPAPPPAPPQTPSLNGSSTDHPVVLVPGGPPASLPITIRNNGNGPSGPVTVTLSTPPGVTAEIPGASGGAHPAATQPSGAAGSGAVQARSATADYRTPVRAPDSGMSSAEPPGTHPAAMSSGSAGPAQVHTAAAKSGTQCSPTEHGISCTSPSGLAPGASQTFDFRIQASQEAQGGEITARLNGGSTSNLQLAAVPVVIKPADGVLVRASAEDFAPSSYTQLAMNVRNSGNRPGLAVATATLPEEVSAQGIPPECDVRADDKRQIRCTAELQPGEAFEGQIWLHDRFEMGPADTRSLFENGQHRLTIPVQATLGSATDSDTVRISECGHWTDRPGDLDSDFTGDPTDDATGDHRDSPGDAARRPTTSAPPSPPVGEPDEEGV